MTPHVQVEACTSWWMEKHHQHNCKLQKIRTGISASWSGMQQQHATKTTTTPVPLTRSGVKTSMDSNQCNLFECMHSRCENSAHALTHVAFDCHIKHSNGACAGPDLVLFPSPAGTNTAISTVYMCWFIDIDMEPEASI